MNDWAEEARWRLPVKVLAEGQAETQPVVERLMEKPARE
jgi:hypothetical protein